MRMPARSTGSHPALPARGRLRVPGRDGCLPVMEIETNLPRAVTCHEDVRIEMPDGVVLSARLWLPDDAGDDPVPLILEHLPYRKRDGTIERDEFTHTWLAAHGYACLRTDMRGNGESGGFMEDEYETREWDDALAVLAWAAGQPWCTGEAGMMGISWGGFNCLQTSAHETATGAPHRLKAVISICSTADRYADDIHTKGGCQLVENWGWASTMLSYSSRPPDPAIVGEGWREMWLARLERQPWLWSTWMRHQTRDAYWRHGSVCEDWGQVRAAVLAIGGWHDGYRNTPAALVAHLPGHAKAIVGPWNHKYPHYAAPGPRIDFLGEAKRHFDRFLKGIDTGVEDDPAIRFWLMDAIEPARRIEHRPGRWIAEAAWPSPAIETRTVHLTGDGLAHAAGPLSMRVDSPFDCGLAAGEYFPFAFAEEHPDDQREDDARSACFDAPPATADTDIVGRPVVRLRLTPEAARGQIAVRLCDVFADGRSAFVTAGFLDLTHHGGHEDPAPLVPGKAIEVTVALDCIAYRLPAGHRLRVAVSTAYFPFVWPTPERCAVTLHEGTLRLPVRPTAEGDEVTFDGPRAGGRWARTTVREGAGYRRTVERQEDGGVTVTVEDDGGRVRDDAHGLESGSRTVERFAVHAHDPLCASAWSAHEQEGGREGARWRTRAETRQWGDATHWHSTARLEAWLEGERVFERDFEDSVPRVP